MSLSDLLAMLPILILAFGATAILMAGAWYREPLPLLAGGIVTALLGALSAVGFSTRSSTMYSPLIGLPLIIP